MDANFKSLVTFLGEKSDRMDNEVGCKDQPICAANICSTYMQLIYAANIYAANIYAANMSRQI